MDCHDHCNIIAPECTTGLLASATGVWWCLHSQKVLAECVPEMYEAQGVQGGNPLWFIWESNKDKYMIIYVNVGENHHTICSQKSMKHRGYRGRGPFDTFNNPFEPTITHQKLKYHHQQCKVMQSPQYEIKWSWFIICDLPRGSSWYFLNSFDTVVSLQYHCTWVHNRPSGISHRCLMVSALPESPGRMCPRNVWSPGGTGGESPLIHLRVKQR